MARGAITRGTGDLASLILRHGQSTTPQPLNSSMPPRTTDVPLREHLESLIEERTRQHLNRFESQERAVAAALAAAKEAVAVAEKNAEKWRESANEWRGAMNDRERQFPTRKELWSYLLGAVFFVSTCFAAFAYITK